MTIQTGRVKYSIHTMVALALLGGFALAGCEKPPETLVEELGDPQTLVREQAKEALKEMGPAAIPVTLVALSNEDARDNAKDVLISFGEESYTQTLAKMPELCESEAAMAAAVDVLEATGTPTLIVDAYIAASKAQECTEGALRDLALQIQPDRTDVTIDQNENLRYKPARFLYKGSPDLDTSRALARLCLYDADLGSKALPMTRDKDEAAYWAQWKMHDPLVRASVARYTDDVIWGDYHDNFIPDIVKEEFAADPDDVVAHIGALAANWRKRVDMKAVEPLAAAHAGTKAYYEANPHYADEPCLVYKALEDLGNVVGGKLTDNKRRKKEKAALDEAMAALKADKEAVCH
jgi:hypothetical protein